LASPVTDPAEPGVLPEIDTTVPHSARIWNYWMGGKDNYEVDRIAGDQWTSVDPGIVDVARASRAFLKRAVTFLTGEAGVRQFVDVGTGLPTMENTHEVAQRVAPEARIVYVDNDPLVLAHARALLTSTSEGATRYIDTDMRQPAHILTEAAETLDFSQPVAIMIMGALGHVPDLDVARSIVRQLLDPMPPGSYLALYDGTYATEDSAVNKAQDEYNDSGAEVYLNRRPDEVKSYFDGLELVEPGFVTITHWRPDRPVDVPSINDAPAEEVNAFGGVGRKP